MDTLPPDWLLRFAGYLSSRASNVITFNYDLLFEKAVSYLNLVATWGDLYAIPLQGRSALGSSGWLSAREPSGNVASLRKMHGSINWAYSGPAGHPSESIILAPAPRDWRYKSQDDAPPPRWRHLYDDLVPMIVPPTHTKNAFYQNRALRAQWRSAHTALAEAEELLIIGFSFPPGDLQVRHFVASALKADARITVVDLDNDVVNTLRAFLPGNHEVSTYLGPNCVMDYVNAHCGDLIRWSCMSTDDGWDAFISVNGEAHAPSQDSHLRPFDRSDNSSSVREWLIRELQARWPSLNVERPITEPGAKTANGYDRYIGYA